MEICQINHANAMPGLFSPGIEYVATSATTLRTFCDGKEISFEEQPEWGFNAIRRDMGKRNPSMEEMKMHCIGCWGGIDRGADVDEYGNPGKHEFVPGISPAHYDCGKEISKGHMRVIKHITEDKSKDIADKVFISTNTVNNHLQAIFSITGLKNKAQVTLMAKDKGII